MEFEWDEDKRAANLEKHGVDFAEAEHLDWANSRTRPHLREGELRFRTFGYIGDRLHVVVWTQRGDRKRVISVRKANQRERRDHG